MLLSLPKNKLSQTAAYCLIKAGSGKRLGHEAIRSEIYLRIREK